MAGLPQIVRLKDMEEVWTVDLPTMASNIEKKISVISQLPVSEIGCPYTFPALLTVIH